MINKKKIGVLSSIVFIIVCGIGMYISKNVFNYEYTDPNILRFYLFVEIVLVALCYFVVKKFYSFEEIGFKKISKINLLWLIPHFCIIIGIIIMALLFGKLPDEGGVSLIISIIIATLFVGIAEETMFRGILLHSFLEEGKIFIPIVISAIFFALLHSVNVFAGLSVSEMIMQLRFTFIFGIFSACVAIKLNNLIPLIIYHFLWDMSLFVSESLSVVPALSTFGIWISIILSIILLVNLFIEQRNKKVKII